MLLIKLYNLKINQLTPIYNTAKTGKRFQNKKTPTYVGIFYLAEGVGRCWNLFN